MANSDEITLQPKNGKKHILFVDVTKTSMGGTLEEISNDKVERIINAMQDKGYEVVDVRFACCSPLYIKVLIIYQ